MAGVSRSAASILSWVGVSPRDEGGCTERARVEQMNLLL